MSEWDMYEYVFYDKFLISTSDEKFYSLTTKKSSGINMIPVFLTQTSATSATKDNVTITSHPLTDSTFSVIKAFDNHLLANSIWLTNTTAEVSGWIIINIINNKDVPYSYKIKGCTAGVSNPTLAPDSWNIYGSNDGNKWNLLDAQTGVKFAIDEIKEFALKTEESHSFYKIEITKSNADARKSLAEFSITKCADGFSGTQLHELESASESVFINNGLSKDDSLDMTTPINTKSFHNSSFSNLGSGKVFKLTIDTSKVPIKKVRVTK
ncbi:hypothetical protein BSK59_16360 [Paenibacillus odorifer]|nr:hypothetical protein BSK59_16360 [Paenibacillus odorifer]